MSACKGCIKGSPWGIGGGCLGGGGSRGAILELSFGPEELLALDSDDVASDWRFADFGGSPGGGGGGGSTPAACKRDTPQTFHSLISTAFTIQVNLRK